MTIRDSLAQVQELLGRATPGPWCVGTYGGGKTVQHWVLYGPSFHAGTSVQRAAQDMDLAALSVNFLRTHGPELMKMLDRHGAGDAEDAPAIEPCVGAEKAESLCVHCFSPPHMWGMICCNGYWNDPRTEMLTETQARAKRAARAEASR